jgi:hypothetical protein
MRSFKSGVDFKKAPPEVADFIARIAGLSKEELYEYGKVENLTGGEVYLPETPKDLGEIKGFLFTEEDDYPSLLDDVECFDAIDRIEGYTVYSVISNNTGGDITFVNDSLQPLCRAKSCE